MTTMIISPLQHDYVTKDEFGEFEKKVDEGFEMTNKHIDNLESIVNRRFSDVESRFNSLESMFSRKFNSLESRMGRFEKQISGFREEVLKAVSSEFGTDDHTDFLMKK